MNINECEKMLSFTTAIEHSLNIGKGNGPTHHFYDLYKNGLNIKKS